MALIVKKSPAKINLMLRIVGQRDNGYHELQSCFEILPWGDEMTFKTLSATQASVNISGFDEIASEDNLIYHAAELLKPYAQKICAIDIHVDKQIPSGAGLGGGSSNAATTLLTLNNIWQCHLDENTLLQMALRLGADVPFFVTGQSALVTGIGEHIEPMRFYRGYVLLLFPSVSIGTKDVFQHPELNRQQTPLSAPYLTDTDFWINDCFPVVLQAYPEVSKIFSALSSDMLLRLSGTGSTLFALFNNKSEALKQQKIATAYCRTKLIEI